MAEEKDQSAEELRRKIQERLNSMNKEGDSKKKEEPKKDEAKKEEVKKEETPKVETPKTEVPKEEAPKKENPLPTAVDKPVEKTTTPEPKPTTSTSKPVDTKPPVKPEQPKTAAASASAKKDPTSKEPIKGKNDSTDNVKQSSKSSIVILLIVLLLGVSGLFSWQFYQNNKKETENKELKSENVNLKDDKAELNQQLKEMLVQYESVKTSNKELNASLQEEKQKIIELLQQIDKLDGKAAKMDYFRRQAAQLQNSQKQYLTTIDSLGALNEILVEKNEKLLSDFERTQSENDSLSTKVEQASKVKGVGMKVASYNSKGKLNKKNKANRSASLEVCITLVSNPLSPKGEKDIYLRIYDPKGKVLKVSEDDLFEMNGEEMGYTAVSSIDYQGEEVTQCVTYVHKDELATGNYDIELYADGALIGSSNIVLE